MELFLFEHALTHAAIVSRADGSEDDPFARGLTDDQLRTRPAATTNSVAWTMFHTARSEDAGVNLLMSGGEQLYHVQGWLGRLGGDWRHNGSGMSFDEVEELSRRIDLEALRAYRRAVGQRTRALVPTLSAADLAEPIETGLIERGFAEGLVHPAIPREAIMRSWGSQTRGWCRYLAAGHNLWHFGEAQTIRSLLPTP